MQLHAGLIAIGRLAVAADTQIAGGHPLDAAVLVVQHLGGGKAGIDLDAERLGLLAEPAAQVAEADDVVAGVVHLWRRGQAERAVSVRNRKRSSPAGVLSGAPCALQSGSSSLSARGSMHRAGQDVRTDLRAFLEHAHRQLRAAFGAQLLEADRGGETRGPGADDHDVVLHRLAFCHDGLLP